MASGKEKPSKDTGELDSPYSKSFQEKVYDLSQKTFLLIIIAIITKVFGLFRLGVTSSIFGATLQTDMFFGIFGSTIVLFEILPYAFNQALVPRYVDLIVKRDRDGFNHAVSTSMNYVLVISLVVFMMCSVWAEPIRKIFFHLADPEMSDIANNLFRLSFVVLFLNVFIGSLTAIIYAHDQVISPSILNFINGINVLICILLFQQPLGIFSMVLGYMTGGLCQIVYLWIIAQRVGFHWRPFNFGVGADFQNYVRPIGPAYLAILVAQLNIIIDRSFTSRLNDEGLVTVLSYAGILNLIILIFSSAFSAAVLPKLSSLKSMKMTEEYKTLLVKGILVVLYLILPIAIAAMLAARPIATLILYYGKFTDDPQNLFATYNVFRINIIWALFYMINMQLFNAFYTFKDFTWPLIVSSINVFANVMFNMMLTGITFGIPFPVTYQWGVIGIAVSTALGIVVSLVLSIHFIRPKIGNVLEMPVAKQIVKLGIASFLAFGIGLWINRSVFFSRYTDISVGVPFTLLQVITVIVVCIVVFWIVSYFVNRQTMLFVFNMLREFLSRKKSDPGRT
jgi:putative peptidoglycan lipid II flippase